MGRSNKSLSLAQYLSPKYPFVSQFSYGKNWETRAQNAWANEKWPTKMINFMDAIHETIPSKKYCRWKTSNKQWKILLINQQNIWTNLQALTALIHVEPYPCHSLIAKRKRSTLKPKQVTPEGLWSGFNNLGERSKRCKSNILFHT